MIAPTIVEAALLAFFLGIIAALLPRRWRQWRREAQRRNDMIHAALGGGMGLAAFFVRPKKLAFVECDTCREKAGSPTLCRGCYENRATISQLTQDCD